MRELAKVGPMSLAKIQAATTFAMSLLFAIPFLLFGSTMGMAGGEAAGAAMGMMVGMAFVIPIAALVVGFLGGLLSAAIYNLLAGWVGGIEVELAPAGQPSREPDVPSATP